ncbi:ribbon-helix-helix protein, CopG family [Candidatus Palauibacter sp.]|uniref:ribbon-helix-helix protein, CopG family n=1 Tax=Candidatus Palauibacter sp. TaxID=3101350 RepID=UPI003B5B55FA
MDTIKTTVYLRAADYGKLKSLAAAESRSAAELVREAVSEYTARKARARLPRSIGMGDSGMPDLAERYEEHMTGFGAEGLEDERCEGETRRGDRYAGQAPDHSGP